MTITNLIFHFGDIYPVLVWVDETAVLVYSGYPGQLTQIQKAIKKVGIPFDKISRIILTH